MYVAAVSEEESKQGKSAGEVVIFRYLGQRNGVHRLENVTDGGQTVGVSECASPCKVIKTTRPSGSVDRIGYSPTSVIGSAFEDAFAGRLVRAKKAAEVSLSGSSNEGGTSGDPTVIPAAFTEEWNSDLKDCGTALNDSRLRIEPKRLRFYENDAAITRVTLKNSRAATVEASFAGEGETWNDKVYMVLSRSGADLTIDGFTRHRCPA